MATQNHMQNTSDILRQLLGVQYGEVTIVLPADWQVDINSLRTRYNVAPGNRYWSLAQADILYTGRCFHPSHLSR